MRLPMPSSIKARLAILVVLTLIPSAAVIVHIELKERANNIERAKLDALRVVNSLVNLQQSLITGVAQTSVALASLPAVKTRDLNQCKAIFSEVLLRNNLYQNILLVDPRGTVIVNAASDRLGQSADKTHILEPIRTKNFYVGEFIVLPKHWTGRHALRLSRA